MLTTVYMALQCHHHVLQQISRERNFRKSARGSEDSSSQRLNVLSPSKTLKRSTRLYIQEEADIQELPPWEEVYKHISLLAKKCKHPLS
jgi:hypothetical protein